MQDHAGVSREVEQDEARRRRDRPVHAQKPGLSRVSRDEVRLHQSCDLDRELLCIVPLYNLRFSGLVLQAMGLNPPLRIAFQHPVFVDPLNVDALSRFVQHQPLVCPVQVSTPGMQVENRHLAPRTPGTGHPPRCLLQLQLGGEVRRASVVQGATFPASLQHEPRAVSLPIHSKAVAFDKGSSRAGGQDSLQGLAHFPGLSIRPDRGRQETADRAGNREQRKKRTSPPS